MCMCVTEQSTAPCAGVMRALCAAFPEGREPAICNEKWVAEDECESGGPGWTNCRVGDTNGRNRCKNTFSGYE